MKKFELPEMNISIFDAESVTMLSATGKAEKALIAAGVDEANVEVTAWSDWKVTP